MVEEQQHGFAFEKWVVELAKHLNPDKSHLLAGYTDKWDLPEELNPVADGEPVSIKTAKWNSGIGFGDARRQFQVDHTFTLVVGFWERSGLRKRVVKIVPVLVQPDLWASLWEPITFSDLEKLDAQIKNRGYSFKEARQLAQRAVTSAPFADSVFRANPKIDSKVQRRLQCSLTQENFFKHLAPKITGDKEDEPKLWGHAIPPFLPGRARFGAV
jgi:hypothetical protein